MKFSLVVLSALTSLAAGQTSTSTLPDCAKTCLQQYTTANAIAGCSNLDIHCICSSQTFLVGIACCLLSHCDAADQESATVFAKNLCATAGVTTPDSVTDLCTNSTSSSVTASGTSTASTAASTATTVSVSSTASGTQSTAASTVSATAAATSSHSAAQKILAGGVGVVGLVAGLAALL